MAKVLGIGGIFFKSSNPEALGEWYRKHLGFPASEYCGCNFMAADVPEKGYTVWGPFAEDTDYFAPGKKDFMFNLMVDDVEEALKQVAEGGAEIVGEIEDYDYGVFGWFMDPDGNKIELWQPK